MPRLAPLALVVLPVFLASAASLLAQPQTQSAGSDKMHSHSSPSDDQSVYTLKEVMQHLAHAQMEIEMGLLTNNRLMIQQGALAIADHPRPKGGIKPYITKNIQQLVPTILSMDTEVHETARELAKAAKTEPMSKLHERRTRIMTACISCHQIFRD